MSKRKVLLFVPLIIAVIFAIIPVICFAATGWWPCHHNNANVALGVTFWVIYGIDLLCAVAFAIVNNVSKKETGITYVSVLFNLGLQFLAPITLLFFFGESVSWIVVFPIVLAAITYLTYGLVVCVGGVYSSQTKETMKKIQAEQAPVVDAEKEFNNDDGTFKGSRVKVNKDK